MTHPVTVLVHLNLRETGSWPMAAIRRRESAHPGACACTTSQPNYQYHKENCFDYAHSQLLSGLSSVVILRRSPFRS